MKIDGSCHCGSVAYEADIDPEDVLICHCTDCQTLSGSAFRTVVFVEEEGFKLLSGNPKTYIKTAESGRKRVQTFCPECGSLLYSTSAGQKPRKLGIRLGTARQRHQLPPKKQYWGRSAQNWIAEIGSIEMARKE